MKTYIQVDLIELCLTYLSRKKKDPTLWDLFWTLHKVLIRLEKINAKGKKVIYRRGLFEIDENWLNKFGLTERVKL